MSSENISTSDRILETTVLLLEQQQGRGVRMSDIARQSGVSRQAVYIHFASRTELLCAATRFLDARLDLDERLKPSRTATSGILRLEQYIVFWGHYIPEIYGVAKALMLAEGADEAAAVAWTDRCQAMREGCRAAILALSRDNQLAADWSVDTATDALWTQLLIPNWESLTQCCGWSTEQYIERMTAIAKTSFVRKAL